MRGRGKAKLQLPAVFLMTGAELRALQQQFEAARDQWEARRPMMQKRAAARGCRLASIVEQSFVKPSDDPDGRPILWQQRLSYQFERLPIVPKDQRPLCGARCRSGQPCQARCVLHKKRCRLHGGLSSGPKTAEGRARIAESNRRQAKLPHG